MSETRRGRRALLVASLLLIVAATLVPTPARDEPIAWCIRCGPFWLSDAIGNVALFIPFGTAIALGGTGVRRAALIGSALSLAIESLQYAGLPPGRTTSLADWLMNTSGAAIGAWMVVLAIPRHRPWSPALPAVARRRLAAWTMVTVTVFSGTSWLLTPLPGTSLTAKDTLSNATWSPTPSRLPYPPGYGWYSGVVDSASVSGVAVPHGGTGPVLVAYAGSGMRDTIRATLRVLGDDRREGVVPLLYVHRPDDPRPILLVGQQQDRLVVRMTPRARTIGLDAPDLVLVDAFASLRPNVPFQLTATAARGRLSLSVAQPGHPAHPGTDAALFLSPGLGWTMIQSLVRLESPFAIVCLALWVCVWFVPGGYWVAAACPAHVRRPLRVGVGLAWGLLTAGAAHAVIAVVDMPRWSWSELCWLALASLVGAAIYAGVAGTSAQRAGYLAGCSDP